MELIQEAYYLQILMLVLSMLDFISTIVYSPFFRFLTPINFILNTFQPGIVRYVLTLYYFILLIPMILTNFYIVKKREVIREYSKYLIFFSYMMLGIIIIINFRLIINAYHFTNYQELQNTVIPFIRDILNLIISILTFGSIILIILISSYKNLKFVRLWMFLYYMSHFAIQFIYSFAGLNGSQFALISNLFSLTQPIILLFIIRSLFLFARDDADLIKD